MSPFTFKFFILAIISKLLICQSGNFLLIGFDLHFISFHMFIGHLHSSLSYNSYPSSFIVLGWSSFFFSHSFLWFSCKLKKLFFLSPARSISFQFVCFHFIYLLHIYVLVYFICYTGEFLISTNANIIFFCGSWARFISHVIRIVTILSRTQL